MPTGYTEAIKDGISFETFVWRCARAMGMLVMMRDDSLDKPIPNKFKPSTYHIDEIKRVTKELDEIEKMNDKQIEKAYNFERNRRLADAKKCIRKADELEKKYKEMLKQVIEWVPPQNHIEFKKFMINQINESIKFDCSQSYWKETLKEPIISAMEWKDKRIKQLKSDLKYYMMENKREIERTNETNLWIKELRDSLKGIKDDTRR